MRKRYRQHINPLKMTSLVPREPLSLPPGVETIIELGCADARFIIERARQYPGQLFVGLDIREEFLLEGRERTDELGLNNVRLEVCNLLVDTPHLFEPGRISCFLINFPDPWFKRRQRRRRWLDAGALEHLVRALCPGGQIFFQSDVWSLAVDALALFEAHPQLDNLVEEWRFCRENPFGVQSTREQICAKEMKQVWRAWFARRS